MILFSSAQTPQNLTVLVFRSSASTHLRVPMIQPSTNTIAAYPDRRPMFVGQVPLIAPATMAPLGQTSWTVEAIAV